MACILAGSLLAASSASGASTGFRFFNLSATPMKLTDVDWNGKPEQSPTAPTPPKPGDVIPPGATDPLHIEIASPAAGSGNSSVDLTYRATGTGDTVKITLYDYDRYCGGSSGGSCGEPRTAVCTLPASLDCLPHGTREGTQMIIRNTDRILIADAPGTVHRVAPDDKVEQAEVLSTFCTRSNLAFTFAGANPIACDFEPELPKFIYGPPHITRTGGLINCTGTGIPFEGGFSDPAVVTNSFGAERGHNDETDAMFARAEAAVTKARARWFDRYTFEGALPFTVPPASFGHIQASNPIIRHTGNFTVTAGNTAWTLPDVYFDVPDARPEIRSPMVEPNIQPWCRSGDRPASGAARPSLATLKRRGDSGSEALVGGPESTTIVALAGSDIVRGASGDDRLYGGPGRDVLYGGPGSDTIVDSRGRTWISTGGGGRSGREVVDVRDGEGDDTIVCGSRKAVVKADRRDRVHHCGR